MIEKQPISIDDIQALLPTLPEKTVITVCYFDDDVCDPIISMVETYITPDLPPKELLIRPNEVHDVIITDSVKTTHYVVVYPIVNFSPYLLINGVICYYDKKPYKPTPNTDSVIIN